ncbi:MAG: class I SAM-dependent methyltransferase [Acidimicrobiia bacterium]|nr:class I SAM-dependent methyltransferase [Acidimicrobiia bacterium]
MRFKSVSDYLAELPNQVLREALAGVIEGPDGDQIRIRSGISPINSWVLYETLVREQPGLVVEIGMGYGVSTVTILSALAEVGDGRLISIDPYAGEFSARRPIALNLVAQAGLQERHRFEHRPSWQALPALAEEGITPQLVYIDGCHDLDCVFVDTFLSDQIIDTGGFMAFNDAGWPSVNRVLKELVRSQRYEELDTGVTRSYRGRNPLYSAARRLQSRSNEDRYFRKLADRRPASAAL